MTGLQTYIIYRSNIKYESNFCNGKIIIKSDFLTDENSLTMADLNNPVIIQMIQLKNSILISVIPECEPADV